MSEDEWQVAGVLYPMPDADADRSLAGDEQAMRSMFSVITILDEIRIENGVDCAGCRDHHIASPDDLGACGMAWNGPREVSIPVCRNCAPNERALALVLEEVVARLVEYGKLSAVTRH